MKEILFCVLLLIGLGAGAPVYCDSTCGTCSGSTSSDCFTCDDSDYLIYIDLDFASTPYEGTCEDKQACDDGEFPSDGVFCYTSTPSPTAPRYKTPEGYYIGDDTTTLVACDVTCLDCDGALSTDCTECPSTSYKVIQHYDYYGDDYYECLAVIPTEGYFFISGTTFGKCNEACATCTGSSNRECLTCPDEQIKAVLDHTDLTEGYCVETCEYGVIDEDTNICMLDGICPETMNRSGNTCTGVREEDCCSEGA